MVEGDRGKPVLAFGPGPNMHLLPGAAFRIGRTPVPDWTTPPVLWGVSAQTV